MAITTEGRSPAQRFAGEGQSGGLTPCGARAARWSLRATALAILCLLGGPAAAQRTPTQFSIDSTVTATDNAALVSNEEAESDLILSVTPRVSFHAQGARFRALGSIGVELTRYVEGTQRNRVLPSVRTALNGELIERWLFLDAAADLATIPVDPFGAQAAEGSTSNRRVAENYRLSPYLQRELTPRLTLAGRSNNEWTRLPADELTGETDVLSQDVYVQTHTLSLEHDPVPLGGAIEFLRQKTRFEGDTQALLELEAARAVLNVALGVDAVVGVVAGRERSEFAFTEETDSVYGLRLRWTPSPRTDFNLAAEDRFFGTGLDFRFNHRRPQMSVGITLTRAPVIRPVFLGTAPGGTSLVAFLDQILITRVPDPVERSDLVQELLRSRGLPDTLSGPVSIVSEYAQLEESGNITLVLLGRRNILTLRAFAVRLEQLTRPGSVNVDAALQDNEQVGASVAFGRRLSPLTAADVSVSWSRIKGLADRAGDQTRQVSVQLGITRQLGKRTALKLGLLRQEASRDTDTSIDETAAFAGLRHQF